MRTGEPAYRVIVFNRCLAIVELNLVSSVLFFYQYTPLVIDFLDDS